MLRRIYIKHIKCSNDSSRLWWNWQFCEKKKSENWSRPIPSIGLGRQTTTTSLSSELLVCGGGVRSILLLPLVARCLETIDVCIWRMFLKMSVVVTVWGSVGMFVVQRLLLIIVFFLALEC